MEEEVEKMRRNDFIEHSEISTYTKTCTNTSSLCIDFDIKDKLFVENIFLDSTSYPFVR